MGLRRRWLASSCALVAMAACASYDGEDATPAPPVEDGGSDVGVVVFDAGIDTGLDSAAPPNDGAVEAASPTGFCAEHPGGLFCVDFDQTGDAGFTPYTLGPGTVGTSNKIFASAPRGAVAHVDAVDSGPAIARTDQLANLPANIKTLRLELEMRIDQGTFTSPEGTTNHIIVGFLDSVRTFGYVTLSSALTGWYLNETYIFPPPDASAPIGNSALLSAPFPLGKLVKIRLEIDLRKPTKVRLDVDGDVTDVQAPPLDNVVADHPTAMVLYLGPGANGPTPMADSYFDNVLVTSD